MLRKACILDRARKSNEAEGRLQADLILQEKPNEFLSRKKVNYFPAPWKQSALDKSRKVILSGAARKTRRVFKQKE